MQGNWLELLCACAAISRAAELWLRTTHSGSSTASGSSSSSSTDSGSSSGSSTGSSGSSSAASGSDSSTDSGSGSSTANGGGSSGSSACSWGAVHELWRFALQEYNVCLHAAEVRHLFLYAQLS